MQIDEIGLYTSDVIGMSNFYRALFKLENVSNETENDDVIQFITTDGMGVTIYNDGVTRKENHQNICLAITVEDVDFEYGRLKNLGIDITEPPVLRPWGAKNMIFKDPEGNQIIFRSTPK